jgi:glycine cleavage system H protein
MAYIDKFLGRRVEVPDGLMYHPQQGLWAQSQEGELVLGLTAPALVLMGGLNDLDWLVSPGETVEHDQTVIFAITAKISYLNTPVDGVIDFNPLTKQSPDLVSEFPYETGWLFKIRPETESPICLNSLVSADEYIQFLKETEGFKNPEGLKGGVSGICKAVYSGISRQKI